jgi:hypothetical protein
MTLQKHYTASELTKFALRELSLFGYTVWRANNIAVPGRKFIGKKGMPDIIGYSESGHAVYCEVKTINDKISEHQIDFLTDAMYSDCLAFICMQDKEGIVKLMNWHTFAASLLKRIQTKV